MSGPKRLLFLVIVLIVYGSLFPWRFEARHLDGGPIWYLLHRWDTVTNSYLVHDVGINVALYIPLGIAAQFAFGEPFGPVLLAVVLASAVEFLQIYIPGRQATMVDILANTAGAVVGSTIAICVRAIGGTWFPARVHKAVPCGFLLAIAAFRLAPVHFIGAPADFEWVPFGALLAGNAQSGLIVLAAKGIAYTTAIGLFRLAGIRGNTAAALVTGTIALIEAARMFAPATSPGITDPLIAAIGGFALTSLFPETETQSRSAG